MDAELVAAQGEVRLDAWMNGLVD